MTVHEAAAVLGFRELEDIGFRELKKHYYQAAVYTHPDHGGSTVDFDRVQKAHKILVAWLRDRKCPTCEGSGTVRKWHGFYSVASRCPDCGGEG